MVSPGSLHAQDLLELLEQLKKPQATQNKIITLKKIGAFYQAKQGYTKAATYFQQAANLEKDASQSERYYRTLEQVGRCYELDKKYTEAQEAYKEIKAYYQENKKVDQNRNILLSLVRVNRKIQNYEEAIRYNQEILTIDQAQQNPSRLSQTYNNLGFLYRQLGENDKSLNAYQEALLISQDFNATQDLPQKATLLTNQGVSYTYLANYPAAQSSFQEALAIWQKRGDPHREAQMYNYLAANQYLQGENQNAIMEAKKAIDIAEPRNDEDVLSHSYLILADAYQAQEDYRESQYYARLLQQIREKQVEKQQSAQQELLEKQIQMEQEENELNTLLAERERQASALRQSELERQKQEQGLKIKEKELALLKRNQELKNTQFKNQELEKQRVEQMLLLAEQKARSERQKRQADSIALEARQSQLLAEKQKIENEKNQKALEASRKDQKLKAQQLREAANQKRFFYIVLVLVLLLLALMISSYLYSRSKAKDLRKASLAIQEKNEELLSSEEELRQNMEELEATQEAMRESQKAVQAQNYRLEAQKSVLEKTYKKIATKNKAITDSIVYAERIQQAILPSNAEFNEVFDDFFVIYRPKDIVSGDFYWFSQVDHYCYVAVVDCTGHGVPGAFMSLIGHSMLDEIISRQRILETNQALSQLHQEVRKSLKQEDGSNTDGMDLALCRFENAGNGTIKVQFSGAKSSLYYIQNQELFLLKGDRLGIGGYQKEAVKNFTSQEVFLNPQDTLYLTTDGYIDMPNRKRKRFGDKRLKQLMIEHHSQNFVKQKELFENALKDFSENTPPRDDITLMGIKLSQKILEQSTAQPQEPFGLHNTPHKEFNFYEYHAHINNADIILSYKGPLTDILLSEFSRDIRKKIQEYPKAGKKVFAIFMELAQNVLFYSKEMNHFGNNDRVGTLVILDMGDAYKVVTGNLVFKNAVEPLSEKCEIVNSLDRERLREYKRKLRNSPGSEESRGAGIGMVQAALTSANPLEYEIRDAGDRHAFFLLSALVRKQ